MRARQFALAFAVLAAAVPANGATLIIFTEPMTLNRYTVVYDTPGRDRVLLCMAPPAAAGCTEVRVRRGR